MVRDDARLAEERAAARLRALAAPVRAPQGLRSAVAAGHLAARPSARRRGPVVALVAGAAVLLGALMALVAGPSAEPGGGAVADAAQVALRGPTLPPPAAAGGGRLALAVDGVAFPDYAREHGWRAVGTRTDTVAGRRAVTVTYARAGRRVGYTIVPGPPLELPSQARRMSYDGVEVAVLDEGATRSIAWVRRGRTCILSTRGARLARLLDFAVG